MATLKLRPIPALKELRAQALLDHSHSLGHKNPSRDVLTTACKECVGLPRSLMIALRWVVSHSPFLRELHDDLPLSLQRGIARTDWKREAPALVWLIGMHQSQRFPSSKIPVRWAKPGDALVLQLAWCVREADHIQVMKQPDFRSRLAQWTSDDCPAEQLLDLTYLPPFDDSTLEFAKRTICHSSAGREVATHRWKGMGISRYDADITSQAFWAFCAGPLAAILRPRIHGRKPTYDDLERSNPIPDAVWQEIQTLWRLRYPEKRLPSTDAVRRRVLRTFVRKPLAL